MLRRGTANTLIVVKLDRLSRSLRDVCTLVEDYFREQSAITCCRCAEWRTRTLPQANGADESGELRAVWNGR